MKQYTDLTFAGRLRRIHNLAVKTLSNYDLDHPHITYHCFWTNLFYCVTTASGERFMLRFSSPGWRTNDDLQSEALWLNALSHDTNIPVPVVIPARSGGYVLSIGSPDVLRVWNACLMSWVPGRLLRFYLTERNLEKMGSLFAVLHHHGAAWIPPPGFTTRKFEHWLSRGEPNLIIGDGSQDRLVPLPYNIHLLLERLHENVETAYAAIDRSDLRIIHCDLWHDNIKIHHGVLHPFDFEDIVWGFRVHDIAMAMLDLLESTDDDRYPVLLAAFRRGYEFNLRWPDERLEPFQIGRLLWKINWFARFKPKMLAEIAERHVPVLMHYLQTGCVIQPPVNLPYN